MKKKTIEKIPYMEVKRHKKDVKYIGITAIHSIGGEQTFFLEVYRNAPDGRKIPKVRIVCTEKDFGTYWPYEGKWTEQKITFNTYWSALAWEEQNTDYQTRRKENVLNSAADLKNLKEFFRGSKITEDKDWWMYVKRAQDSIASEKRIAIRTRRYEKRTKALEERKQNTTELNEKEIVSWADKNLFYSRHYLYYKKHGRYADVCCSACGNSYTKAWKRSDSFQGQYEATMTEPVSDMLGRCEKCGEFGRFKAQGRVRSSYREFEHVFISSKYKETGACIRYVEVEKEWELEQNSDGKKTYMQEAYENMHMVEIARAYFEPEKDVQIDYQKVDMWRNKRFWDDCNFSGLGAIIIRPAALYQGFTKNLQGTMLQYSAIELFNQEYGRTNAIAYMKRYRTWPQIEMIVKLGLYDVAKSMMDAYCGIIADSNANRPDKFLGISVEDVKKLIEKKGDRSTLEVMQYAHRNGYTWTEQQIECIAELNRITKVREAMQYVPMQKMLNYIEKQSKTHFGDPRTKDARRHTLTEYADYLTMRQQLGYDMQNTVYLYPRDLAAGHQKMIEERDDRKLDDRLTEVEEKFKNIAKEYRKLRKRFLYEDEEFIIRPAKSAKEIVLEGRRLHHCVGGDGYLKKHNEGESYILMLRFKRTANVPYVTVEIRQDRIVQWYGEYDKKPDQDKIQKWLDAYVTRLKCTQTEEAAAGLTVVYA